MRLRQATCLILAYAGVASAPAQAQIAPGVRAPANITEAVMMAHLFGCVGAVTDRPTNGLNIPLSPDATGVAIHPRLPETLRSRIGELSENAKFLSLASPQGDAWIAFDPEAKKCIVTAVVPSPGIVGTEARAAMDRINLPRLSKPAATDATGKPLPTYDWDIAGTPAVHLRVIVDASGTNKGQVSLISIATKSE